MVYLQLERKISLQIIIKISKQTRVILLFLTLTIASFSSIQTQKNTSSPYSQFGIGDLA